MSTDVTLVLVTHRSSAVAPAAAASFRAGVRDLGLNGEVVIVDHSEDASEERRIRAVEPEALLVRPNRGYAAGINAGVAAANGRTIFVGNPDIEFAPGSVASLLDALGSGWDVVGPQFTLAGFLLPPADLQTPGEQLRRWLSSRVPSFWRGEFRRELVRWRSAWNASVPLPARTLSGALLAFTREAFARAGAWDEGYFLFFEEIDWQRRAAAAGLKLAQVGAARVEHVWGHAADPERTGAFLDASRARFLGRWYGWRGRLLLRLRSGGLPFAVSPLAAGIGGLPEGRALWLMSPSALGFPAGGLVGSAADLLRALRDLTAALGGRRRFLVFAADPGRNALLGAWSWEANDG